MFTRLREALGRLPEDERECLVLHRLAGLRYAEIAEIVGTSTTRVRALVHAAIERLREDLADFETRILRLG
jgi:RNA polymerase sigma factor (sigma-70 family)